MNSSKKPDGVAWDEENEVYIAKLLPYATTNSSPVISIPNVDAFKQKGVEKVSKQFVSLAADTQKVYSAKFKFEPVVGESYHLYAGKDGENFLSLISPDSWNKEYLGTFRLNGEYKWERQD